MGASVANRNCMRASFCRSLAKVVHNWSGVRAVRANVNVFSTHQSYPAPPFPPPFPNVANMRYQTTGWTAKPKDRREEEEGIPNNEYRAADIVVVGWGHPLWEELTKPNPDVRRLRERERERNGALYFLSLF